jgi:hypothetical protein
LSLATSPRAPRCRLLHLRHVIGCLGTSGGSSRSSSSTTFPSAAHHRLLCLRRASGCLGTSHDSSRDSSSTTSPTPRVRVPRHVTWLVMRLVVDYFAYAARPGALARRAARRPPRAVSPLDFSSIGRTGSRRAPDHSISRLDYSVCRHSTCCPVALALL